MIKFPLFFIILLHSFYCRSQDIFSHLDKVTVQDQIKSETFIGRIDASVPFILTISEQSNALSGKLVLPNTNRQLSIYGTRGSRTFHLRDSLGFNQGNLVLHHREGTVEGVWQSTGGETEWVIEGIRHSTDANALPHCSDSKYVFHLTGFIFNTKSDMYLQKSGQNSFQGSVIIGRDKKTAFVKGQYLDGLLHLMVTDIHNKKQSEIIGQLDKNDGFIGYQLFQNGNKEPITLQNKQSSTVQCRAEWTSLIRYQQSYPLTDNELTNNILDSINRPFVDSCLLQMKQQNSTVGRSLSDSPFAYSHMELTMLNAHILSGIQVDFLPWNYQYKSMSVNFDLDNGQPIYLDDLLKTGAELNQLLINKKGKALYEHPLKNMKLFQEWSREIELDHFSILPSGILFSSTFHPAFGPFKVLVSYKELKPFIKNKQLIRRLRKM